jgi:hypothetical protein
MGNQYWFGRFAASLRGRARPAWLSAIGTIAWAAGASQAGAVPVYAFAADRVEIVVSGATVTPLFTDTRDSAHLVQAAIDYGNTQNDNALDALQAASGAAKPPPQNSFQPVGANAGLARSDVLVTPFGAIDKQTAVGRNVAETYMANVGSGAGSGENEIDFRVTQTSPAAIRFTLFATPGIAVETTTPGDSSAARVSASLEVFDPTGAKKALWLPCGSTGPNKFNNCAAPGNGLTVDAGFAGTVTDLLDPFSLNTAETCNNGNCKKTYQPGAGAAKLGAFLLAANVGRGSNILVSLDVFEADLVSGTELVAIDEPNSLLVLALGLIGVGFAARRKRARSSGKV